VFSHNPTLIHRDVYDAYSIVKEFYSVSKELAFLKARI
jgi:hypothetical protein